MVPQGDTQSRRSGHPLKAERVKTTVELDDF